MKRTFSKLLTIACALSFASISTANEASEAKSGAQVRVASAGAKGAGKVARAKNAKGSGEVRQVEMFEAMDNGLLQVNYVGKDSTQASVLFENKTGEALDVVLPETFGAIHINPQMMGGMGGMGGGMGGMGGMGMGGMGMGGMGGGMGGQGMGGGFGGGMGGMGGMGGGMGGMGGMGMGGMGGMMRVEPDKVRKVIVPTLCLEHGKKDPNPRMKYKIVRLEEVNDSPVVAQLCKAVANGKVSQNIGQAAAWHVANGLSWHELISKPRSFDSFGGASMYFSRLELENAVRLVGAATSEAEMLADTASDTNEAPEAEESIGETLAREASQ